VSSRGNNAILRFNGTNGVFIDSFVPSGSGGLDSPWGLAFGPDRNLYVCSAGNRAVLRFSGMAGTFMDAVVPPGSVGGSSDVPNFLTFTRPKLQILKELNWTSTFVARGCQQLCFGSPRRARGGPMECRYSIFQRLEQ
jgi:hypothetical protein